MDALVELIAGQFGRVEPRRRVGAYLRGLLAGLERKNGWTLAEHAGAVSPDGMQRLLRTAKGDLRIICISTFGPFFTYSMYMYCLATAQ